jgi:hypothetical protein
MKRTRTWSIQRQTIRRNDAQTRWDQAYQHLLQWTADREETQEAPRAPQEVADAHCPLCPRLDQPTSPNTDYRATTGAPARPHRQPRRSSG